MAFTANSTMQQFVTIHYLYESSPFLIFQVEVEVFNLFKIIQQYFHPIIMNLFVNFSIFDGPN